jgi:hypothetical protein
MDRSVLVWNMLILSVLLASGPATHAQQSVTGIVVDSATFAALPSVNVKIKHRNVGTQTDSKGNFAIAAQRSDTLVFSLVGYETLELPLIDYEDGVIRLSEKYTMLEAVTIDEFRAENLYEGMFEEQNARLKKSIPFYFSKARKEKIRLQGLKEENLRVQTYVDVVVNNPELKMRLMKEHSLTEKEYYDILMAFNETHYRVMYYLTRSELISLLNGFYENRAALR